MKRWIAVLVVVLLLGLVALTFFIKDNKPKVVAQPVPKKLPIAVAGGAGAEGSRELEESTSTPEAIETGELLIRGDEFEKIQIELEGTADSFPAIVNPPAKEANDQEVRLGDDDLIIGVSSTQSARAYPIVNLAHPTQAVVNDVFDDRPIVVSWNSRNRSALVFRAENSETVLVFEPTARGWQADLILRDKSTESYWSQLMGTCVSGQLKGTQLFAVPSVVTTWGDWKKAFPRTTVAVFDKRIEDEARATGKYVTSNVDRNRLFAIMSQGNQHLIKFDEIFEQRVMHTKLGDFDIVAFYDDKSDSVHAYHSIIANQPTRFEWKGLLYVVANSESIWNIVSGKAEDATAQQKSMNRMFVLETSQDLWNHSRGKQTDSN